MMFFLRTAEYWRDVSCEFDNAANSPIPAVRAVNLKQPPQPYYIRSRSAGNRRLNQAKRHRVKANVNPHFRLHDFVFQCPNRPPPCFFLVFIPVSSSSSPNRPSIGSRRLFFIISVIKYLKFARLKNSPKKFWMELK